MLKTLIVFTMVISEDEHKYVHEKDENGAEWKVEYDDGDMELKIKEHRKEIKERF